MLYCIKGACCSSQLLIKEEHPFAASLLLKGHAALVFAISEGLCFKAVRVLGFCLLFRAYLVLSFMFVARPACCFKLLVVTASAGTWNLQQQEANV